MLNGLSVWDSPVRYIRGGFSTSDGLLYTLTSGKRALNRGVDEFE
jgi:hypothetical protein